MQVFWLPPDVDCEAVYGLGEAREELSLVVHSDSRISVPALPALFVYQIALWVAVRYSEALPGKKQYCFHLEAQSAASLHELAKLIGGNVRDGFYLAASSHGNRRPGLFSPRQEAMFTNYCEARTNLKEASSNMRRAEVSRNQANDLYLQIQAIWLQADGMLGSIEEDCREAGFDPTCYFKDETNA